MINHYNSDFGYSQYLNIRNTERFIHVSHFGMSSTQIHNGITNPDIIPAPWTRLFSKITQVRTTLNSELTGKIIPISSTVGN